MTENVTRLPGRAAPGNGGGGGSDLGERVAKLESDVSNIADVVRRIESDLRSLWYAGLIAVALLLGTLATGYFELSDQIGSLDKRVDAIDKSLVRLQEQNRQILQRLDQLTGK